MATKQQIPVIAARLTEFQDEFSELSTEYGQWVIMNGKEAAELFVKAVNDHLKTVAQVISSVLSQPIATVFISPTTKKFVAKDNFKVDISGNAKVKISGLGEGFVSFFLEKIEDPFFGSTVYGRKLEEKLYDGQILQALGGDKKAETTLTELYAAMAAQPNGEIGSLLNNGWGNIFYIKDINDRLRPVNVFWENNGWYVHARDLGPKLFAGCRVFSRNSSNISGGPMFSRAD
jgi:hypothetical protein